MKTAPPQTPEAESLAAISNTASTNQQCAPTPTVLHSIIAGQPFFKGMKAKHLQLLADSAMQTKFERNQMVFQKGDHANRFYVILNGRVALESANKDRRIQHIQNLGPQDILGWSWLFPPYYWHFDALALEPTDAIFFYGTRLRTECDSDHEFGYELMKRMSQVLIARLQLTRQNWIEDE